MSKTCLVCAKELIHAFSKNDIEILECRDCQYRAAGMEVTVEHTDQFYADDYFLDGADGYSDYLKDGEVLKGRGQWYGRLLKKHGINSGRLLDVGAAAGFLAKGFEGQGFSSEGLEPNHSMVKFGRQQLNLNMHQGSLESTQLSEPFDVVCIIQVLAHLTDPARAFDIASRLTKPGGHWLIETWNYRSMAARIFGKSWHQYSPPRTLHWFTPPSLAALAAKFGMQRIAMGRPDKSITAQHAKSLLKHATSGSTALKLATAPAALIPNRLKIPYLADDVNWYLFRKNDS